MDPIRKYGRFIVPGLLALTLMTWLLTRGPEVKKSHAPCLVHGDCHSSERCLVSPADDGFATEGVCVDPCEGDLQCPAQHHCQPASDRGAYWAVAGPGRPRSPNVGGCQRGARHEQPER